jgi:polar amino acid transport system substrate-binding protein
MNKKLVGIAIVALLIGFLIYPILIPVEEIQQKESTMDKILREGKIKTCYIHFPPLTIKDPNTGKLSGESIDAIEYIANESGLEVEYVESTWGTFIAALQSGKCDVVGTAVFTRIERAKSVSFTRPMFYLHNSVLIKKGDQRFKELEDFNNKDVKIAVIQGEVGHLYAQKHLPNAELIVLPGSDISLALSQVSSGNADAVFTDGWTIEQYVKEHPETVDFLDVNPKAAYGMNPNAWAVRQEDTDLRNFLDTAIYNMEADGKFLEWEEKYGSNWLRPKFELEQRE